jgi:hypothetical protein
MAPLMMKAGSASVSSLAYIAFRQGSDPPSSFCSGRRAEIVGPVRLGPPDRHQRLDPSAATAGPLAKPVSATTGFGSPTAPSIASTVAAKPGGRRGWPRCWWPGSAASHRRRPPPGRYRPGGTRARPSRRVSASRKAPPRRRPPCGAPQAPPYLPLHATGRRTPADQCAGSAPPRGLPPPGSYLARTLVQIRPGFREETAGGPV